MLAASQNQKNEKLTAYIGESRDREMNTFYDASICDDEEDALIAEVSGYDRDKLIDEVLRQYPGTKIQNA